MPLSMGEKIKVILTRRNMTISQLAEATGQSRKICLIKCAGDNLPKRNFIPSPKLLIVHLLLVSR